MGSIDITNPLSIFLRIAINISGDAKNQTQGCWVRGKNATSVLFSHLEVKLGNFVLEVV